MPLVTDWLSLSMRTIEGWNCSRRRRYSCNRPEIGARCLRRQSVAYFRLMFCVLASSREAANEAEVAYAGRHAARVHLAND